MLPAAFVLGLTLAPPELGRVEAAPVEVAVAARGVVSVTVLDRAAPDLPLLVRLTASPGLRLLENRLDWSHVVDRLARSPRLEGRFQAPNTPGSASVRADVRYYVCEGEGCHLRTASVTIAVTVVAAD